MSEARIVVFMQDYENAGSEEHPRWKASSGDDVVVGVVDHTEAAKGEAYLFATYIAPNLPTLVVDGPDFTSHVSDWALLWSGQLTQNERMGMEYDGVSYGCKSMGAGGQGAWCPIWTPSAAQRLDRAA